MFNLTQVGNRIDISSEGIDFTITPAYASGTSLPIANIEANGYDWEVTYSGTLVANVKLIVPENIALRNCSSMNYGIQDGEIRNNSLNKGKLTSLYNDAGYAFQPIGAVAANNYIYWYLADTVDKVITAFEYNIQTGEQVSVQIFSSETVSLSTSNISYIKDRKVLVTPYCDEDYNTYMVDFSIPTGTAILTSNNPMESFAFLNTNNDIFLLVSGYNSNLSGMEMSLQKYDSGKPWSFVSGSVDASFLYQGGTQVADNYFGLFYRRDNGADDFYFGAFVLNLLSGTVTQTNELLCPTGNGYPLYNWNIKSYMQDILLEKLYAAASAVRMINAYPTPTYASADIQFSLNPKTATLTLISSRANDGVTLGDTYYSNMFGNKSRVYCILSPSNQLYTAYNMELIGTLDENGTMSMLADDNGFWVFNSSTTKLKKYAFSGGMLKLLEPTFGGTNPIIENKLWNIGNKLLITYRRVSGGSAATYFYIIK